MQTQLQPLTQYQKRILRKAEDIKYIEKKLVLINQNKTEILFDIRQYQKKHFNNTRNNFVHAGTVAKLLHTSKQTINLLAKHNYILNFMLCSNFLIELSDLRDFIKSLPINS